MRVMSSVTLGTVATGLSNNLKWPGCSHLISQTFKIMSVVPHFSRNTSRPILAYPPPMPDFVQMPLTDGNTYILPIGCVSWMLNSVPTMWGSAPMCAPFHMTERKWKALLNSGCLRSMRTPSSLQVDNIGTAKTVFKTVLMVQCKEIVKRALCALRHMAGTTPLCDGGCLMGDSCAWSWLMRATQYSWEGTNFSQDDFDGALAALATLLAWANHENQDYYYSHDLMGYTYCEVPYWNDADRLTDQGLLWTEDEDDDDSEQVSVPETVISYEDARQLATEHSTGYSDECVGREVA